MFHGWNMDLKLRKEKPGIHKRNRLMIRFDLYFWFRNSIFNNIDDSSANFSSCEVEYFCKSKIPAGKDALNFRSASTADPSQRTSTGIFLTYLVHNSHQLTRVCGFQKYPNESESRNIGRNALNANFFKWLKRCSVTNAMNLQTNKKDWKSKIQCWTHLCSKSITKFINTSGSRFGLFDPKRITFKKHSIWGFWIVTTCYFVKKIHVIFLFTGQDKF